MIDPDRWRVIEPLLDQALDLPDDERAVWLEALRERSPADAAEIEHLLAGQAAADRLGFLTGPLAGSLEGMELGAYTLERRLAQGGMGSVWLARRTDGRFEGAAAVKLLNLALLSPIGQERFRREGSVLARLSHPGIARLLDAGVTPDGQPYLVLEHVDGLPIDRFVRERGLPLEARIRLFLQVLDAVGHAHANLIVHRDLKPSNILVTADGSVKLLDFGIAKLLDARGTGMQTALTVEAGRALTPEFAAPEQVRGETITTATDVYALGVLLYLLVSGRHPTAQDCRTGADAMRALFDVEPPRLRLGDLDTILAAALRKDPARRYQTVAVLAEDLGRYLRHEPVSAQRASVAYRARKFVRRNRAVVALAAVTAAGLLAAMGFSLRQMREAERQRDAALYARRRADAQVEFQQLLMSEVGTAPITMRGIVDRARAAMETQYSGDPRLLASILAQLSARYADLGDSRIRGRLLARADSLARAGGDSAELAEIRCDEVDNLRTEGRYDEAERALDRAQALLRVSSDPRARVTCLQTLAELDDEAGDGHRALPAIRRAIAIRDSLGQTRDMTYIGLFSDFATALDRSGRHREALDVYRRAMAIMDSTGRSETMDRAIIQHDYAVALLDLGETARAERLFHDVLERIRRSDPAGRLPDQPLIHYAHAALFQADFDSAARYFSRLYQQAARQHDDYWQGRALFGLAQAQLHLGELAAARLTANRFRRIAAHQDLRSIDDQITDPRVLDADFALAAGDTARAHTLVVAVLRSNGYFQGRRRRVFRSALILAAGTALSLHRPAAALAFANDARIMSRLDSLTESGSAYVGEARLVEARALLARGDTTTARESARRAVVALRAGAGPDHPRTRQAERLLAALGG